MLDGKREMVMVEKFTATLQTRSSTKSARLNRIDPATKVRILSSSSTARLSLLNILQLNHKFQHSNLNYWEANIGLYVKNINNNKILLNKKWIANHIKRFDLTEHLNFLVSLLCVFERECVGVSVKIQFNRFFPIRRRALVFLCDLNWVIVNWHY